MNRGKNGSTVEKLGNKDWEGGREIGREGDWEGGREGGREGGGRGREGGNHLNMFMIREPAYQ